MGKRFALYGMLIGSLAGLSACGSSAVKINPLEYSSAPIERAEFEPSKTELELGNPRVAIMPLEFQRSGDEKSQKQAIRMEPSLRGEIEKTLVDAGNIDLLDRTLALRLKGALAEFEKRGGQTPKAFKQAEYLLISQIDLATIDTDFKEAFVNKKGRTIPSICITEAKISGVLKIYDLLENQVSDIQNISGRTRDVEETDKCSAVPEKQETQYFQLATKDAMARSDRFLKTFFAPLGYISEKRTNGKIWLFKVYTKGSAMAVYKEARVIERKEIVNKLTDQIELETVTLGTARITDQVGQDFVWVLVTDENVANRIQLGHVVKPIPQSSGVVDTLRKIGL